MKIYVVRHGETSLNAQGICQGSQTDISINEVGINQAINLSYNIGQFDYIFCSPMKRTIETANILNSHATAQVILAPEIIERDYGEFDGLKRCEFKYPNFWNYKLNIKYKKAENIHKLYYRVANFLDMLKKNYSDKKVLLVTHGGVVRAIEMYVNKIYDTQKVIEALPKNCEIREYIL